MTESIDKQSSQPSNESSEADDRVVDPEKLVYSGGPIGDPQEILQNPAVAPQMLNQPDDLRDDLMRDPPAAD